MGTIELIEMCNMLATGNISDAGKTVVKTMDPGIRSLDRRMKMAGPAFTVECPGGNNLAIHHALVKAPKDAVLVINVGGYMGSGHMGDIMCTAAQLRGIRGVIMDGTCRDAEDIVHMQFPMFCRGTNPYSNKKLKEGKLNEPTKCGGVLVSPGDFIVADASGVVVIPKDSAKEVIENAHAIAIKEMGIMKQLYEGKTTIEIYNLDNLN